MQRYIIEMVQQRRTAEKKEERYDLLSSLLDASEAELDGTTKLTDGELLSTSSTFDCLVLFISNSLQATYIFSS